MLNVIRMTMKTITFATEEETSKKVLELSKKEGTKFQVIGRHKIVIYE